MDKTQIILFSAAMAFLIVRLYQKYIKKGKAGTDTKHNLSTSIPSSSKDDDYEPYSKK